MSNVSYLTKEGFDRIRKELDDLKSRGRDEASKAIAEARDKGDLSENAEYDAAKDAQGMLELKINELEKVLANAKILDASSVNTDQVSILTKVRIKNLKVNREMEYTLVSESEANVKEKKISVSSPIGAGLIGKKRGEIAVVQTPAGEMKFEILDISI
jgi:transcription elongation factor GreA